MNVIKFVISLVLTLALVYCLNRSWVVGTNRLPPLGKFLDPFHGFWANIEPDDHKLLSDELSIPGLKDKVTIVFDSLAIPHVFASNDEDLYLAQGYITASHRLWQMEFQTHAAAGRVSEITGEGANGVILNFDRGQRRLGLAFGAKRVAANMQADPASKMSVEKYSEGINRYIESLSYEDLPFEYKLLDYEPEQWSDYKCALVLMNMAQTLNMGDKDMEMSNALKMFGKETIDLLFPDLEAVSDPIVNNPNGWKFNQIKIDSIPKALPDELIALDRLPESDPTTGSNNWAVAGSKTSTGAPILCGDPHLNLSLPSIWYAIQLSGPNVNVMGASLPGSPSVIIGFNDSIAWSVTNAQRDLVDWYKIDYEGEKRDRYHVDGKARDTRKVVEAFNVRGKEIFYDTVIYTHWGPVVYDKNYHPEDNRNEYAFRWIAHEANNEVLTFHKLNRGKNHDDYMEALNHFSSPAQNFVFASVSGDVAMRVQGKYPVRRKDEGRFVLDGTKSKNDWQAFIPNEQNVMEKNPARGFVSSANQYPVDATYPYYVTGRSFEAYRNRRINKVLSESSTVGVKDMMALQGDNYNLKAEESLPYFLSNLDTTSLVGEQLKAYTILKSWNYYNDEESQGASYYEAWWDNLMPLVWDEMAIEGVLLKTPTTFVTIQLIKEKPELEFFDLKSTPEKETAREILRKAFALGVDEIEKWRTSHPQSGDVAWADFKDSYVGHLLRIEPLSIHIRHGGNHDIVNAHSRTHGPSWRMVVSLEKDGMKPFATYPGGQSGNPGSKHYNDLLQKWVADAYHPLLFMHQSGDYAGRTFSTTQLTPQ